MSFPHLCKTDAVAAAASCRSLWKQWRASRGHLNLPAFIQKAEAHVQQGELKESCALLTWLRSAASWFLPEDGDGLLTWIQLLSLLGRVQAMLQEHRSAQETLTTLKGLSEDLLGDKLEWLKEKLGKPEMLPRIALRWKNGDPDVDRDEVVMMHIKGHFLQNHVFAMRMLCDCQCDLGFYRDASITAAATVDLASGFSFESPDVSALVAMSVTLPGFASKAPSGSDYNSVEEELLKAEAWFLEHQQENTFEHARVLNAFAAFYSEHGVEFKAYVKFMRAAKVFKLSAGANDLLYATCLVNISTILGKYGGNFTALKAIDPSLPQDILGLLDEAVRIYEEHFPLRSVEVAEVLSKLAAACSDLGQIERSLKIGREALEIFDEHHEVESARCVFTIHALAVAMCRAGQHQEAIKLFERSLRLQPAESPEQNKFSDLQVVEHREGVLQSGTLTPNDQRVRTYFNIAACCAVQDALACEEWLLKAFAHLFWVWDSHIAFGSEFERWRFVAMAYGDASFAMRSLMMLDILAKESWVNVFNIVCKIKGAMYQMQALQHAPAEDPVKELQIALGQARRSLSQALLTGSAGLIEDFGIEKELLEKQLLQVLHQENHLSPLKHLDINKIAFKLRSDEVLVEYVHLRGIDIANLQSENEFESGDYGVFVVASTDSGLPAVQFRMLGSACEINASVANFRDVIITPRVLLKERLKGDRLNQFQAVGMRLTKQLVEPIFDLTKGADVKMWFIAADAELSRLPFAALPLSNQGEGQRYLLDEDISWSFIGSSGDFVLNDHERDLAPVESGISVLVGDPNYDLEISSGDSSTLHLEDVEGAHRHVICDECARSTGSEKDLRGVRYKCNDCPDFDLCEDHFQQREKSHDHLVPHGSTHTFKAIDPPACKTASTSYQCVKGLRSLSFEPLEATRNEVEELERLLIGSNCKAKTLVGDDAVASKVLAVAHPPLLHLATHGFFLAIDDAPTILPVPTRASEKRPWKKSQSGASKEVSSVESSLAEAVVKDPLTRTGLAFAGAKALLAGKASLGEDFAVVTASDVRGMDLHSTQLVTLSACETGLGYMYPGESVWGLVRGFRLAGARSVVATLWQVPDEEHSELMLDFYRGLLAGESKVAALKHAQRTMRNKFPEVPWIWASVVLYGSPKALRIRDWSLHQGDENAQEVSFEWIPWSSFSWSSEAQRNIWPLLLESGEGRGIWPKIQCSCLLKTHQLTQS